MWRKVDRRDGSREDRRGGENNLEKLTSTFIDS
jgi:hypothetical protein